jgi:hypothetical protein
VFNQSTQELRMCHNIFNHTNVFLLRTDDRKSHVRYILHLIEFACIVMKRSKPLGAVRNYPVLRAACVTEEYIDICLMEALGFDIAQQCLQSILANIFDNDTSSGYFFSGKDWS